MTRVPAHPSAADLVPTAGQTVGPFFHYGTEFDRMNEIVRPFSPGAIMLTGILYDGGGDPVPDGLIEIWQQDSDGTVPHVGGSYRRDDARFSGFGRAATNPEGRFLFWTRNPGAATGSAPFFSTIVYARGLMDRLHTRIYLPEKSVALDSDPLLGTLDPDDRASLIATRTGEGNLEHDIRLQGHGETVFLTF